MKLMLCCRANLSHNVGGMEMVYQLRAEELAKLGHEVHGVTTCHKAQGPCDIEANGVHWHHMDGPPGRYSDPYAEGCAEWARKLMPDIIHLDSQDDVRPWWLDVRHTTRCIAATQHGANWSWEVTNWTVFMLGEPEVHRDTWTQLRQGARTVQTFDRLITISKWEQLVAQVFCGRFDAKLVYNPIAARFFDAPRADGPRTGFIAMSGRWPEHAVKAGEIAGLPVRVLKGVRPEDMAGAYDGAVGFILPSFFAQGYDLTIAEALSRQCPVICYATGSRLLETRPGVLRVRTGDVQALAEAIRGPLPVVPPGAAADFHPAFHAQRWLEAVA